MSRGGISVCAGTWAVSRSSALLADAGCSFFSEKNEPLQQCQRTPGVLYNEVSVDVGAMFG